MANDNKNWSKTIAQLKQVERSKPDRIDEGKNTWKSYTG